MYAPFSDKLGISLYGGRLVTNFTTAESAFLIGLNVSVFLLPTFIPDSRCCVSQAAEDVCPIHSLQAAHLSVPRGSLAPLRGEHNQRKMPSRHERGGPRL